ncbi:S1 family peptidase [Catenulispora rubra]|uniref:S1 family peptidase n=1 Tax=Catenulispora rubra TaxID=280293 RepID=UPI0018927A20|nr:serine protease [Catenulispora rubra]
MLKRTAAMLAAAAVTITAALTLTAGTASAAARPGVSVTLASTIALDDCSASLVRYPTSQDTDQALMLTAGHCYEGGMPSAGQVLQNVDSSRSGTLLDAGGNELGTVQADKLLYATMTNTDVAVYELTDTFASLRSQYGATPLTLSASHPTSGHTIAIPSAYWDRTWSCTLNGFAGTVEEDQWTWHDSLRYGLSGCRVIGGSSGSPVVDTSTGQVVGVNNTINESGQLCTLDNPCEVAANGTKTEKRGQGYGQETYWITTCLNSSNAIDLTVSGCRLPSGS